MIQLIYVSAATKSFSTEDLSELLGKSRANNTLAGLTGMLLYRNGSFIQVLEGESDAVNALVERIGRDPRHTGIEILSSTEITDRAFGDWSMGFYDASDEKDELIGFSDFFGKTFSRHVFAAQPSAAKKWLLAFRDGKYRLRVSSGEVLVAT